jgi:hypothetical protein
MPNPISEIDEIATKPYCLKKKKNVTISDGAIKQYP